MFFYYSIFLQENFMVILSLILGFRLVWASSSMSYQAIVGSFSCKKNRIELYLTVMTVTTDHLIKVFYSLPAIVLVFFEKAIFLLPICT